jgi:hypothetical protein
MRHLGIDDPEVLAAIRAGELWAPRGLRALSRALKRAEGARLQFYVGLACGVLETLADEMEKRLVKPDDRS